MAKAGFWKPGAPAPLSLEVDRGGELGVVHFGGEDAAGLAASRERRTIAALRSHLLYLVENHQVTVVVGATGCGKTTQLPQFLVEAGWAAGGRLVGCTQPRRVACQSVALRVAEERGTRLGDEVGYSIRFEEVCTPGRTRIKFLTDGVLLRELLDDPLLSAYSVLMIDEAHERSLATDVLLGLLKKVLRRRADLRLVVASATLEAAAVASYFDTRTIQQRGGDGGGGEPGQPSREPAVSLPRPPSHPCPFLTPSLSLPR
jgi:ATP-dependent RNA helicase DDX35